jgi:aspartyl-tRNA(Asn)/glutamyl-tRNA(Gln) amidotransferase subunit A
MNRPGTIAVASKKAAANAGKRNVSPDRGSAPLIEDARSLLAATHDATRFTYGGALAAIPGVSLPGGFTKGGLPIGVMLEAAWWNEPALFRVGFAYQQETDWHLRRAPILDA